MYTDPIMCTHPSPPIAPSPSANMLVEMSVAELSSAIKNTIEQQFRTVRVRGELSGVTHHRSGHIYMELKDDTSNIRSVCWRSNTGRLQIRPENGLEVIITGRITTYDKNSTYQLVIGTMEVAGIGALLAMLEKRKKKLQAEGLFDPSRKKPLPFLPRTIGVITSPSGAVIRDILHRVADRYALPVLVYPAKVQGEGTATEVVKGIQLFNNPPQHICKPDVIIIARGGGSVEDLWAFNDESIVRAVAQSKIPIVSAIGHATDTTLIDYVADVCAPTPTAAAEIILPIQADLLHKVHTYQQRYTHAIHHICKQARQTLHAQKLPQLQNLIHIKQKHLSIATNAITRHMQHTPHMYTLRLMQVTHRCVAPTQHISTYMQKISHLHANAQRNMHHILNTHHKQVTHTGALLNSYSYKNTLKRGFALVQDTNNTLVTTAKIAKSHTDLHITFADGTVSVKSKPPVK